jgi:coproporphyrinogen III oxidase-like Fe-S oxidoreductase
VLSEAELQQLFEHLHRLFISAATREITVEAGRPDTLSLSKLKLLKEAGTNRICINPQTMNDETLVKIGRAHDREGVVQSVIWAKEAGFKQINMDLIVGLPDEGKQDYQRTAEEILALAPENITVHTLAVMKNSAYCVRLPGECQRTCSPDQYPHCPLSPSPPAYSFLLLCEPVCAVHLLPTPENYTGKYGV